MSSPPCEHNEFEAFVGVQRLVSEEDGAVIRYHADVKIRCKACRLPFRFLGADCGLSLSRPTVSFHGDELRAPIVPAQDAPRWDEAAEVGHA